MENIANALYVNYLLVDMKHLPHLTWWQFQNKLVNWKRWWWVKYLINVSGWNANKFAYVCTKSTGVDVS